MPSYFFHFCDGETRSVDDGGLELDSLEQAYLEAVAGARAMWPELLAGRTDPRRCAFEVTDATGEELFRLEFSELLDGCRGSAEMRIGRSSEEIRRLEDTHDFASSVTADLRSSFDQVRQSLNESAALLARLSAFEGWRERP